MFVSTQDQRDLSGDEHKRLKNGNQVRVIPRLYLIPHFIANKH